MLMTDKQRERFKKELEKIAGFPISEVITYEPEKGGGFAITLESELGAFRLHYHYRFSAARFGKLSDNRGFSVCVSEGK